MPIGRPGKARRGTTRAGISETRGVKNAIKLLLLAAVLFAGSWAQGFRAGPLRERWLAFNEEATRFMPDGF